MLSVDDVPISDRDIVIFLYIVTIVASISLREYLYNLKMFLNYE